jgi:hypothetical protein
MFGPIDVPGSGYNGGGSLVSPAGWKLQSVTAATVMEVVGVQQSNTDT